MSRPLLLILFVSALLLPGIATAGSEEEAARQLEFAEAELAGERFDKALQSAESALRLNPTLYRAMAIKGLAYEGLGDLELAESLLRAYCELSGRDPNVGEVGRALARIEARQQLERSGRREAEPGAPTLSSLQLRRERARVFREERALDRARDEMLGIVREHAEVWRRSKEPEALFLGGWALAELGELEAAEHALTKYQDATGGQGRLSEQARTLLTRIRGDDPPAVAAEGAEAEALSRELPDTSVKPRDTKTASIVLAVLSGVALGGGGVAMGFAADAEGARKAWDVGGLADEYGYSDEMAETEYYRAMRARNALIGTGVAGLAIGGAGLGISVVLGSPKRGR